MTEITINPMIALRKSISGMVISGLRARTAMTIPARPATAIDIQATPRSVSVRVALPVVFCSITKRTHQSINETRIYRIYNGA